MLTGTKEELDKQELLSDDETSQTSQQLLLKKESSNRSLTIEEPIYNNNNYSQENDTSNILIKSLKIKSNLYDANNNQHNQPTPITPQELISNFNEFSLFHSPRKKNSPKQSNKSSLTFPDIDEYKQQNSEIVIKERKRCRKCHSQSGSCCCSSQCKAALCCCLGCFSCFSGIFTKLKNIKCRKEKHPWIKRYYPTTWFKATFFCILRFIRMGIVAFPVVSMIGAFFTHTAYINFIIGKVASLWALIPGIALGTSLALTLSWITVGLVGLVILGLVCRLVWHKLIKKKFLNKCNSGLKSVKAHIIDKFTYQSDKLADFMLNLGIIGNQSNAILSNYDVTEKNFADCYQIYQIYLMLVQQYNSDRMGPYDIAKERLASQLRLFSVFMVLIAGVGSQGQKNNDRFMDHQIHYGIIYNIILGMLIDASQRSNADHRNSKYFSCCKGRITKSHYALMLEKLIDSREDRDDNCVEIYTKCRQNWLESIIIHAETQVGFVYDDESPEQYLIEDNSALHQL